MPNVRRVNRSSVLSTLFRSAPTTRNALAAATGLSAATVTRAIDALRAEGYVHETTSVESDGPGRPATLVDIVADREYVAGVDLGASNTRVIVADLVGKPLVIDQVPTAHKLPAEELGQWLAQLVLSRSGDLVPKLREVYVGLPGAVSPATRTVSNAPNLPQSEDPAFLFALEAALSRPVGIDNDANFALLGELHYGAAASAQTAVMFTIGAGMGAGVAIDRRILAGRHGLVGEYGQLPVGPFGTRLEHLVTGPGVLRRAREAGQPLASPADLFADPATPAILSLREQYYQALLAALTAAVITCDPDIIILGGRLGIALGSSIGYLHGELEARLGSAPQIGIASLGNLAGARGAVAAALEVAHSRMDADSPV